MCISCVMEIPSKLTHFTVPELSIFFFISTFTAKISSLIFWITRNVVIFIQIENDAHVLPVWTYSENKFYIFDKIVCEKCFMNFVVFSSFFCRTFKIGKGFSHKVFKCRAKISKNVGYAWKKLKTFCLIFCLLSFN